MSYKKSFIIVAVTFLLQPLFSSMIPVLWKLDFMACFAFVCTLVYRHDDVVPPIVASLVFTFLKDLYIGQFVGSGVIGLLAVIGFALAIKRVVNIDNQFIVGAVTVAAIVVNKVVIWIVGRAFASPYTFGYAMSFMPKIVIVNLIASMILYAILINKIINDRRDRYFR